MTRVIEVWRGSWLAFSLVCCLPGVAQDIGAPGDRVSGTLGSTPQSDQRPRTVRGQVVNSVTGDPIYRALAQVGPAFGTLTDHEGRFELENVTSSVSLTATKPGYFPESQFRPITLDVSAPSDERPVILRLVPEAILSGTVTGAEGEALEGIQVHLQLQTVAAGLRQWMEQQQTTTNSEGEFRFANLAAGRYSIATGIHLEGLPEEQSSRAYMPAHYPATGAAVQGIALTPGQHIEARLNPPSDKLYLVTGTASGYGEYSGVTVVAESAEGDAVSLPANVDARTGEFRVYLPSGALQLRASIQTPTGLKQAQLALTIPQAPVRGVSLALEPGATITAEIEVATASQGPEQPGAVNQNTFANLTLVNADPNTTPLSIYAPQPPQGDSAATANGVGPRKFENVPPGRYRLDIGAFPWYVSSAYCGGLNLQREELVVGGSAVGCAIRVVLRNDAGSVHVSITKAAPEQDSKPVVVVLLPLDDLTRSSQVLGSGQATEFLNQSVPPGRYLVIALDHEQELAYRDPESLKLYEGLGQVIAVTPNGKTDAEVSVVKGEL